MVLVDSAVWIDFFNVCPSPEVDRLKQLLGADEALTGDLILTEVLQGFRSRREFSIARNLYALIPTVDLAGRAVAVEAAVNSRDLRARGITIRKTIDTLIATWCILNDVALRYSDRDFDPFVAHLGLRSALDEPA